MKNFHAGLGMILLASAGVVLWSGCGDDDQADSDATDAAADGDLDSDTGTDTDTDSASDGTCPCAGNGDPCSGYPEQCDWDLGKVVTNRTFAAVFGSGDDVVPLDMCEVFENRERVKSLVFAVGQQG